MITIIKEIDVMLSIHHAAFIVPILSKIIRCNFTLNHEICLHFTQVLNYVLLPVIPSLKLFWCKLFKYHQILQYNLLRQFRCRTVPKISLQTIRKIAGKSLVNVENVLKMNKNAISICLYSYYGYHIS